MSEQCLLPPRSHKVSYLLYSQVADKDASVLRRFGWSGMVIDEGHRLKGGVVAGGLKGGLRQCWWWGVGGFMGGWVVGWGGGMDGQRVLGPGLGPGQ